MWYQWFNLNVRKLREYFLCTKKTKITTWLNNLFSYISVFSACSQQYYKEHKRWSVNTIFELSKCRLLCSIEELHLMIERKTFHSVRLPGKIFSDRSCFTFILAFLPSNGDMNDYEHKEDNPSLSHPRSLIHYVWQREGRCCRPVIRLIMQLLSALLCLKSFVRKRGKY